MNNTFKRSLSLFREYKWNSVLVRYWKISTLIIVLPFLILIVVSLFSINNSNRVKTEHLIGESINKSLYSADSFFGQLDKQFAILVSNNQIISSLTISDISSPIGQQSLSTMLLRVIELFRIAIASTDNTIESIQAYSLMNHLVFSTVGATPVEKYQEKEWYQRFKEDAQTNFVIPAKSDDSSEIYDSIQVSYGMYVGGKLQGLMVFNVNNEDFFNRYFREINSVEEVVLTDKNGLIIYSNQRDKINHNINEFSDYAAASSPDFHSAWMNSAYYTKNTLANVALTIYAKSNARPNTLDSASLALILILCILFVIIIPAGLSLYLSVQFYNTITEIIMSIQNPISNTANQKSNELLYIQKSISSLVSSKENIEKHLVMKMSELKKAQSIALQTQLNPHFLFNTLNLISLKLMRIPGKESEDISQIVVLLSELLSITLNTQEYIVSVSDELSYAKKYVDIQQIKYKSNFSVVWEIDKNVYQYCTIKMILQPIIENVFEHGFLSRKGGNKIEISAQCQNSSIVFTIADNGVGISPSQLSELRSQLANMDMPENSHIGLKNVNRRIKLIFGEEYGCDIDYSNGKTIVVVKTPCIDKEYGGEKQ